MKILLVTDIHSDYAAATSAYVKENPDLVLDCGDHEEMKNLFDFTPHYFVHGNHEPKEINLERDQMPMPHKIDSNVVYKFRDENFNVTFSGIGGNYSKKEEEKSVNGKDLHNLMKMPRGLDILLLHESPFNVEENKPFYDLSRQIIKQIKRISPKFVFSGHTGIPDDFYFKEKIRMVNLEDMGKGYATLEFMRGDYVLKKIKSRFR
jgi:predicted phosphodiesterase